MKNSKMYESLIPHFRKMDNDLQLVTVQIIGGEKTTRGELAKRVGKSKSWVDRYAIPRIKRALEGVAVIESSKRRNNAGYHLRLLNPSGATQPVDQAQVRALGVTSTSDDAMPDTVSVSRQILSHFQKNPDSVMDAVGLAAGPVIGNLDTIRAKLNMLCREGRLERASPGRFRLARETDAEVGGSSDVHQDQLGFDFTKKLHLGGLREPNPPSDGAPGNAAPLVGRRDQEGGRLPFWFIPPWTGAIDLRFVVAVDVADGRLMIQLNKGGYYRGPRHPEAERVAAAVVDAVTNLDGARRLVYGIDPKE